MKSKWFIWAPHQGINGIEWDWINIGPVHAAILATQGFTVTLSDSTPKFKPDLFYGPHQ